MKKITFLGWLGIIILFNSTLLGGASQLGDLALTPEVVKAILAVATLGNGFLGGLVTMFSTQASQTSNVIADPEAQQAIIRAVLAMPGVEHMEVNARANQTLAALAVDPNVPKIDPEPQAKIAVAKTAASAAAMIALLLLGAMAWPGDASAAVKLKTPQQVVKDVNNFINHPATTVESALQSGLSQPMMDLQTFLQSDLEGAAALAIQIPSVQDGNGQACWTMLQGASAVFKAHPIPLTLKVATDIEAARLLVITANKICQNAQCTQVFNEISNSIKTVAPMSLSVPSITSLCSQVPQIAVVAPTPVAATIIAPASTGTQTSPVVAPATIPPNTTFTSPSTGNPSLGAGPVNPTTAPAVTPPVVAPAPAQP
jgi:hypothetical protein